MKRFRVAYRICPQKFFTRVFSVLRTVLYCSGFTFKNEEDTEEEGEEVEGGDDVAKVGVDLPG